MTETNTDRLLEEIEELQFVIGGLRAALLNANTHTEYEALEQELNAVEIEQAEKFLEVATFISE